MLRTRNKAFPFGFPSFVQEFIQNVPHKWVLILICLLFFIPVNLEGTQFATLSAVSNYVQPVTEILLVQIFLVRCFTYSTFWKQAPQKLQWSCCCFFQWLNPSTEILSFSIHTDALLKKQLKIGSIPDSVFYRVGAVKGKLQNLLFFFAPLCHQLFHRRHGSSRGRKGGIKLLHFRKCPLLWVCYCKHFLSCAVPGLSCPSLQVCGVFRVAYNHPLVLLQHSHRRWRQQSTSSPWFYRKWSPRSTGFFSSPCFLDEFQEESGKCWFMPCSSWKLPRSSKILISHLLNDQF